MKGNAHEVDPFSKFIGRIETEIEIYAHYVLNCTPTELTARVGVALIGLVPEFQFPMAPMLNMRGKATRQNKQLRQMALGSGSHDVKTQLGTGPKAYWAKMTPEERSKEVKRRRKVSLSKKKK